MHDGKPETFCGDLTKLPAALMPLTERKHWVNWRWEQIKGRWTKPPYRPSNPSRQAKSNDPRSWSTYDEALQRYQDRDELVDGIGVMLPQEALGAVDLDDCRTEDKTKPWAQHICEGAPDAYREITVSGTGERLIGTATGGELQDAFPVGDGKVERYRRCNRFITISGLQIGDCEELPPIDEYLDCLRDRYEETAATPEYDRIIREGVPDSEDRSAVFHKVIWHLAHQGYDVEQVVEELGRYPDGIARKYAKRLEAEVRRSFAKYMRQPRSAAIEDFFFYSPKNLCIFEPTGELWAAGSVNMQVQAPAKKMQPVTWLANNRAIAQMTWAPGEPKIIEDKLIDEGGWFDHPGAKVFNNYRPPTIARSSGKVKLWRDHLYRICPKGEAENVEMWLAHRVQRPEEKINHALVVGGAQGIGKDTMFEPVKRAVGPWNWREISPTNFSLNSIRGAKPSSCASAKRATSATKFPNIRSMST